MDALVSLSLPSSESKDSLIQQFVPEGSPASRLMIVGEAPGDQEVLERKPFVGPSGLLLNECLVSAGLSRSQAFITNVCRSQPPGNDVSAWMAETLKARAAGQFEEISGQWVSVQIKLGRELLLKEIALVKPTVVVALGNLALWALTGEWGVRKWRSSIFQCEIAGHKFKVIPGLHPAAVLREYPAKNLLIHDLRRVATELKRGPIVEKPAWNFVVRPTYEQAISYLDNFLAKLDAATSPVPFAPDIETRAGHIACFGFATDKLNAISIPFMCVERLEGYWTLEEEVQIILRIRRLLTHPMAEPIWQNGPYDLQYEFRWHFIRGKLGRDTMLTHHAIWSISLKSLDFLSSLYCDYHYYWKDDGKLWDPSMPEDRLWSYNCEDCVRTFEIAEAQQATIKVMSVSWPELPKVVDQQHRFQRLYIKIMERGMRADEVARAKMAMELMGRIEEIRKEIFDICGQELNIGSHPQMVDFFYNQIGLTPIFKRLPGGKRGNPTCDEDALLKIQGKLPMLQPLIARIMALRSGGVFHSTFVMMRKDFDGRYRTEYVVPGTKTYRLASRENVFGSGGNLQNVPVGDDEESPNPYIPLPNIRKLFLFDQGMTGFDLDGDSADLRIVTGESGCRQMQAYFAAGVKPYVEIAREFYRDRTITKHHPSYRKMKALCHGSNYGGEPTGLSERIGLPVHNIEKMQAWYFGMCPEIKDWQEDIKKQIVQRGYIQNPFGYRLYNWDRPSRKLYNEALAWTPQSTVGILINLIMLAIDEQLPWVQLLLQVHDSTVGQFETWRGDPAKQQIKDIASSITIPCCTGDITVPAGLKTSTTSWGDCK